MNRRVDVLFVNSDPSASYQDLGKVFSAIEPPTWSLLLAESCRSKGFGVQILDCGAERLSDQAAVERIKEIDARLVCFVVYGQNPNSGTTTMESALSLCGLLKTAFPELVTCFVGSHVSALPLDVLGHPCVDLVLLNEGVYSLHNLLRTNLKNDLKSIKGIGFKEDGFSHLTDPERIVPQERMDFDLPGYAWDLLPRNSRPLDLYRAHFWHAGFDHRRRTPFAAIYTSLGCRFKCDFCMINILNRVSNDGYANAASSPVMRFWSTAFVFREIERLADLGVETIRFSDEMFFLDRKHFEPLLSRLVESGIKMNGWSYSRVDTVRPQHLELFRQAGIEWLALGVEAANKKIRREVSKGTFEEVDIRGVVESVRSCGINVIANYMFGLPDDNFVTMQETLDLAIELNTEMANMYPCHALPGSPLYFTAVENGWSLPKSYSGYGFLSYDCQPLPTKYISAAEVLGFRDNAWKTYFTGERFLSLVERKFGIDQRRNVESMGKVRLRRRLLGH